MAAARTREWSLRGERRYVTGRSVGWLGNSGLVSKYYLLTLQLVVTIAAAVTAASVLS